jgi:3-oxoacyl-[acyl-carrier protein] reductase
MITDLDGRVSLITGASRGIGRAIALGLANAGAHVAVNYLSSANQAHDVCALIEKLGRRALPVRADVSRSNDVTRLTKKVEDELGPVSILVNNAGVTRPQAIDEITERDWDEVVTLNLKSCFLVTQAVLPRMRTLPWGRIINLSSVAAQLGGVVGPHYSASKAGILGLTRSYAALLANEAITVNAIAPALVLTDMVRGNPRATTDLIPVGRFGDVEEVSEAALMLARNGYITGQTINVNGGWYMS